MKKYLLLILPIISMIIVGSCKKESTETPDIYGSWIVLQTDDMGQNYRVELKFNTDNSYDWILLDTAEGHSNSYAKFDIVDKVMVITDDADCDQKGEYYLIREVNKLAIISIVDGCEPRARALEYLWEKK